MADWGWLLMGVAIAALLGLGLYCQRLTNQLRELTERLADQDTERHLQIREINKRLDAYLQSSIGMGEELRELSELVAPLPGKVNLLEQRDPSGISFTQAAKLVGMGASADDIAQSCGLSRGEAELVTRLNMPKHQS